MKDTIRKEYRNVYEASNRKITTVNVPEFNFLMIDGVGNPRVDEFKQKSEALRIMSREVRDYFRKAKNMNYLISPLEGIWDTYDEEHFDVNRKTDIKFTLMIAQPKLLDQNTFNVIRERVIAKKSNPYLKDIYVKRMHEGECVQMLHKGTYQSEIDTTKRIMEYITVQNMKLNGFHHEIYLNDPEKVKPEKLKTIVRYPVEEQEV